MSKTTSQIVKELRQEYNALKVAFMQSAAKLQLITKTIDFSTSKNLITETQGGYSFSYEGQERVVVTLATSSGVNTLAKLEISGDYSIVPIVRRVPFSGGARWIVSTAPNVDANFNWQATNYQFTVQTLVNGTLNAKMIWE